MIIKILIGIVLFILISFWLMLIVAVGVSAGLKQYFDKNNKEDV